MTLFLGRKVADQQDVEFPVEALRRHFVALGAAGSGKTVLCKCLMEEAVRADIPVLIVDPQGDIASLALRGVAEDLEAHGTPLALQEEFFDRARVALFTPASSKGIPLSANPLKFPPPGTPWEESIIALDTTASSLASFLGYELDEPEGKGVKAYLAGLLEHLWRADREVRDLADLAKIVKKPPAEVAGELKEYVRADRPDQIAMRLRQHTAGAGKLMFQMGSPMDMAMFLDRSDGRVPVNVVYLNTLTSSNDKQFFVANLLREVYLWMLQNPADGVQLLLYVDEIAPYIPPYPRNPPPKEAYRFLFKQARKYGLGLVAATQNVTDIDYKALAQVNTWCLGRIMTLQELKYVRRIIRSIDPEAAETIMTKLPSLRTGEFLMLSPDVAEEAVHFRVRWLASDHRTLDDTEIPPILSEETRSFYERYELGEGERPPASGAPERPEDAILKGLKAGGRALTAAEVAGTLGVPEEVADEGLQSLEAQGRVATESAGEGEEPVYFPAGSGLDPARGIGGEVQVIRTLVPQVEVYKRAERLLEGGLFSKDEEVVGADFRYLPLWRVEATWLERKLMVLQERGAGSFYLHAATGAFLSLEGSALRFERVVDSGLRAFRDLDDDPDVLFESKLPSEVEEFPEVVVELKDALKRVERTFGVQPRRGELALLPAWSLTIRHKETGEERTVDFDGATGRILVGAFRPGSA